MGQERGGNPVPFNFGNTGQQGGVWRTLGIRGMPAPGILPTDMFRMCIRFEPSPRPAKPDSVPERTNEKTMYNVGGL